MLGIEGKWRMSLSIGDNLDFVTYEMLQEFTINSQAGGELPSYVLVLKFYDNTLLRYFNESQVITLSYGVSGSDMQVSELSISLPVVVPSANDTFLVSIHGVLNKLPYLQQTSMKYYKDVSSQSAIKSSVSEFFSFETNYLDSVSNDTMTWIQPSVSTRTFVSDSWLRSNLKDSTDTVLIGITPQNKFKMLSLKSIMSEKPKFVLQTSIQDEETNKGDKRKSVTRILVNPDYLVKTHDGALNSWFGYDQQYVTLDMSNGSEIADIARPVSTLSLNTSIPRPVGVTHGQVATDAQGQNVHSNWVKSKVTNLNNLASLSNSRISCNFSDRMLNVEVLDMVQFIDTVQQLDSRGSKGFQDYYTGAYIVTHVAVTIQDKSLNIALELCREAMNELKNAG